MNKILIRLLPLLVICGAITVVPNPTDLLTLLVVSEKWQNLSMRIVIMFDYIDQHDAARKDAEYVLECIKNDTSKHYTSSNSRGGANYSNGIYKK